MASSGKWNQKLFPGQHIDQIKRLLLEGKTKKYIADKLGVCYGVLRKFCVKHNIKSHQDDDYIEDEMIALVKPLQEGARQTFGAGYVDAALRIQAGGMYA